MPERTRWLFVGVITSRDIKEASFEYGYILSDTYKSGGTPALVAKILPLPVSLPHSILDTLHPLRLVYWLGIPISDKMGGNTS